MSHNTWIHRSVRVLVRPMVRTPVTPNHLTALRLVTGLAAAAAFAVGEELWQYYGAALFFLSILLDRADGELARLGGKTTSWGHAFDRVSDMVCEVLVFVGIGIGLRESILGPWSILMGIVAGAAVALIFFLFLRVEMRAGQAAAETQALAGFDPDDAMVIVPLAIVLGGSVPLLVAATVGTPVAAVYFYWHLRSQLKG